MSGGRDYWGGIPQLASSPHPNLVPEPFHHTQYDLRAPPSQKASGTLHLAGLSLASSKQESCPTDTGHS